MDDVAVGKKLGLNYDLVLAEECANFYVLEDLVNNLTERRHWGANGRLTGPRYPKEFMSDSRVELLAYSALKTMDTLQERIAKEVVHYLSIACGGELRHIRRHLRGGPKYTHTCKHKCGPKCCAHDCNIWDCASAVPVTAEAYGDLVQTCMRCYHLHWTEDSEHCLPCPECNAESGSECLSYTDGLVNGGPSVDFNSPSDCSCVCGHSHEKNCSDGHRGCTVQFCCGHTCDAQTPESRCWTLTKIKSQVSPRVQKYLDEVWSTNHSRRGDRNFGWEVWQRMSKRTLAQWMYECAESFEMPVWGASFGGKKWAIAARLAADYLSGVITSQTFLDRCWSLQHNGGCIFNKFYPNLKHLMVVLEVQSQNDYVVLASVHCSGYVRGLWYDTQEMLAKQTGDWSFREKLELARQEYEAQMSAARRKWYIMRQWGAWPVQFVVEGKKKGCECCARYLYCYSLEQKPCAGGKGAGHENPECEQYNFYQQWLKGAMAN